MISAIQYQISSSSDKSFEDDDEIKIERAKKIEIDAQIEKKKLDILVKQQEKKIIDCKIERMKLEKRRKR